MSQMPDALTAISHLINSPPGQLAAGGVLAGIVWKFFERVEAVLTDQTKLEIAVWLLGVNVERHLRPDTFAKLFDTVFGASSISLKRIIRSCLMSVLMALLVISLRFGLLKPSPKGFAFFGIACVLGNLIPDYLSLVKYRYLLQAAVGRPKGAKLAVLMLDFAISGTAALIAYLIGMHFATIHLIEQTISVANPLSSIPLPSGLTGPIGPSIGPSLGMSATMRPNLMTAVLLWILPAFFSSLWFWLYAGSGFLSQSRPTIRHRLRLVQPEVRHRKEAAAIHWASCRGAGGCGVLGSDACE